MQVKQLIKFATLYALAVNFSGSAHASEPPETKTSEALIACVQMERNEKLKCLDELIALNSSPLIRLARGDENKFVGDRALASADFAWALSKGFPLVHSTSTSNTEDPKYFRRLVFSTADAGMHDGAAYYLRYPDAVKTSKEAEELTFLLMMSCHPASLRDLNLLYIIKDWAKPNGITDRREMILRYRQLSEEEMKESMDYFIQSCWNDTSYFPGKMSKGDILGGMNRARARTAKAIANVKNKLKEFPELEVFSYKELAYTPSVPGS